MLICDNPLSLPESGGDKSCDEVYTTRERHIVSFSSIRRGRKEGLGGGGWGSSNICPSAIPSIHHVDDGRWEEGRESRHHFSLSVFIIPFVWHVLVCTKDEQCLLSYLLSLGMRNSWTSLHTRILAMLFKREAVTTKKLFLLLGFSCWMEGPLL